MPRPKTTTPFLQVTPLSWLAKAKSSAPWLNWIEQPPPKGQVAGSNPAGVTKTITHLQTDPKTLADIRDVQPVWSEKYTTAQIRM